MARVVGLDLGSYSVKAVVFETSMRGYVVRDHFSVPRPQEGDRAETLKQALSALMQAHPMTADSVVVALPGPLLATHALSLPFTDTKRLEAALPFEVEAQLPFDLDEAVYDYQVAGTKEKKSDLIVGVVRKPELQSLLGTLSEVKIEPRIITHPAIAYQSLLINHPALFGTEAVNAEAHVAIIDIGHERTSVAIGKPGGPLELARTFAGGGKDLTRALAAEFNTALPDAELWKVQHGALGSHIVGPDSERAAGAFVRGLQPVLRELRSTIKSYTARTKNTVSQVFVCGGTARMPGIEEQLSRDLAIPAQVLALPQEAAPIPAEQQPALTQAFALALRGTLSGAKAPRFNFRRGEYGFKGDFDYVKDKVGRLVGFGVVLLLLFIASGFVRNSLLARREKQVDQMLCDVTQKVLGSCEKDFNRALSMLKGKESPAAAVPKYSAATLLAELIARVPADVTATFDQIVIDLDRVTLRGETDNSKSIDKITTGLKSFKCFKEVKEGKVEKTKDGQKVSFRLDIQVECPESAPTPPQG